MFALPDGRRPTLLRDKSNGVSIEVEVWAMPEAEFGGFHSDVIDQWVSTGAAPSEWIVAFPEGSGARPLCAYPAKANYVGGDGRTPSSFECR